MKDELAKHAGQHELVKKTSDTLVAYCDTLPTKIDTSSIKKEVLDASNRYDKLCKANFDVEKQARVNEQNIDWYLKALEPVRETLERADIYLEYEPVIGLEVEKGREDIRCADVSILAILLVQLYFIAKLIFIFCLKQVGARDLWAKLR